MPIVFADMTIVHLFTTLCLPYKMYHFLINNYIKASICLCSQAMIRGQIVSSYRPEIWTALRPESDADVPERLTQCRLVNLESLCVLAIFTGKGQQKQPEGTNPT